MEASHTATSTISSDSAEQPPPPPPQATSTPHSDAAPKPALRPTLLHKLRFLLLKRISQAAGSTDRTLLRLSKLLSTPRGTDILLCTTSYTLTLVHALLSRILERRLADIATEIAEKASDVLFPGETLIATLPAPASTKLIAQIVGSSKAVAGVISDFRIFVRLWGLLDLYTWARSTYTNPLPENAGAKEKTLRSLTWASIASCVAFQVLENGAYLSSKGALTTARWTGDVGKARENQWWLWSSQFWAAYVGIELVRLAVVRYYRSPSSSVATANGDGEKEDKIKMEERIRAEKEENWLWWRDLISNLAYAPMTLHWSVEQGLLSDMGVGICGMIAGGSLLVDAWKKTA
ncbi:peroxin 11c protein [Curvularia clavata]|uniref:Peroxin 11c protein n=1 Tax=Curvularia clavata TaxID=95742 RepID=A0A9Q8ZGK5_CURCL|nr:peroxin 11c protein [Curvularia clavata]